MQSILLLRGGAAAFLLAMSTLPMKAHAQETNTLSRDYCPARPGLGSPTCTIEPGAVSVEIGLLGWTRNKADGVRTNSYDIGDTQVRIGVNDTIEAVIGWQMYSKSKTHQAGVRTTASGVGDAMIGAKFNLKNPDGSGFSAAIQPFVSIPVGDKDVSAGDWGAGLVIPVSYDLADGFSLQYTHEFDAAVNESGKGRHFATSGTIGLGHDLSDSVGVTAELQLAHDDDPAGKSTQLLSGFSIGWTPSDNMQFDIGTNIGLNKAAPDFALYGGISRRF